MFHFKRVLTGTVLLCSGLLLTACAGPGYRCPLDPTEIPESPTACAGMQDALTGAKLGTGGRTSVLMDDQGRLVPPEMMENRPLTPLAAKVNTVAGDFKASPTFEPSKKFQVWTPAYVDGQGVAHDAQQSWFVTPGNWRVAGVNGAGYQPSVPAQPRGTVIGAESAGDLSPNLIRPTKPSDSFMSKFFGSTPPAAPQVTRVVVPDPSAVPASNPVPGAAKEQNKANVSALSAAVNAASNKNTGITGVTVPAVLLGN